MKKLDKYVLLDLGFEENLVTVEESGDKPYVYYTLDLNEYECLISNDVDYPVTTKELFTVNLFNTELGFCYTDEDVKSLYKCLMGEEMKIKSES